MKEFNVSIVETLKRTVTVNANSGNEAEDMVHKQWREGKHVLGADDFNNLVIFTEPKEV